MRNTYSFKSSISPGSVFTVFAFLAVMCSLQEIMAQDAADVLRRMDDVVFAGEDQTSGIRLIMTDRSGNERVREAKVWQKGSNKRLFRFTSPAAEAGIAFLSLPDDVMYLYMPAYGRERRIATHVRNQSFAGTDFSYEDLEALRYSERFEASIAEEKDNHYILRLVPLPGTRSDYSEIIVTINREHYYPERMKSFDRGGQEYKIADYRFERKGDYWTTTEIRMTNLKRQHSTRMIFDDIEFDTGLDDDIFTVRNLTRY